MPPIRIPERVLAWREHLPSGLIMRRKTFKGIKRRAGRAGYKVPSAVGGKAYWVTTLRKYLDTHPSDIVVQRLLSTLVKRRGKRAMKRNPRSRWYVGSKIPSRKKIVFSSSRKPTQSSHGHIIYFATGPFKTKAEAERWARYSS
jgi:hypothetical protein